MMRLLLLVAAACVVYANSFGVPFLFDDRGAIVSNLRIRELWPGPFTSARPILELTLAANYALGGLHVVGYHAVNLALHIGCGLLLYDVARRTLRLTATMPGREARVAWWAALVFLVHPLQTEAVTYIINRSEVLMAFWYLATLDLVLVGESHAQRRLAWWTLAVVTCALGMATKPAMVSAPIAAWWLSRCVRAPEEAGVSFAEDRAYRRVEPSPVRWPLHVALAATWLLLIALVSQRETPGAGLDVGIGPLEFLRTQLGVTWHYLRLLVWPVNQTIEYDWPVAIGWTVPAVVVPAIGWAVILALLVWLRRTGRNAAAFWLALALLALAPSSSVVPIADLVFEHRMYLPLAGFAVLAALAGAGLARRVPRLVAVSALVAVTALGVATVARNRLWHDPVTLWEDALAKAPTKPRIFRNLISAYEVRGDRVNAARIAANETAVFERLHRAHPRDPEVLTALADAYARRGRLDDALALLVEAVQLGPDDALVRTAYGSMLLEVGRPSDAVAQLEMAQVLARAHQDWVGRDLTRSILTNLGWAYASVGRETDAIGVLRQAADGGDIEALNNLGSILGRVAQWDEARRVLEYAHERDPDDPNVESNLGWVYANLGRLEEASELLEDAIVKQPSEPSGHGNLGWVRLRAGDPGAALTALAVAQSLDPDNAWIANMQGIAHARLAEWPAAIAAFKRAITLTPDSDLARENLSRAERHELAILPEPPPSQ
ncbi:MAG: tetratricopeptide repeat protein [Deltaproteobacteria bacterium]|nr:tetratricopeptide repeat protein [Deltaproteobacteria bacterium]